MPAIKRGRRPMDNDLDLWNLTLLLKNLLKTTSVTTATRKDTLHAIAANLDRALRKYLKESDRLMLLLLFTPISLH